MLNERFVAHLRRPSCSVNQVAEVLGMSRQGVVNAIERGDIQAVRIGKRIVVPTAPLRKMLLIDDGLAAAPAAA